MLYSSPSTARVSGQHPRPSVHGRRCLLVPARPEMESTILQGLLRTRLALVIEFPRRQLAAAGLSQHA